MEQLLLTNRCGYSTVTLLAKFRGLSTSVPRTQAVWWASSCSGTTVATHAMRQLAKTHRQMRSARSKRKRWPRTRLIHRASQLL